MADLRDLYQETILDHYKHPRNHHAIDGATQQADGVNPLCGDKVTVYVQVEDGVVKDVGFEGSGCAISTASASLMTEALKGKTVEEARALFEQFHDLVTGQAPDADAEGLGKLVAFSGVCEYPVRIKCATLVWHTLQAALENRGKNVTTE
jgi:nitrogen fixation protein NifU and related proteins